MGDNTLAGDAPLTLPRAVEGGAVEKEVSHSDSNRIVSLEDNVQYLFYSMKLVKLLQESKLAESFQLAKGIEKLFGGDLPQDCPARLLLEMKESVEEYEKEVSNESTSSDTSSTSSGSNRSSREVSEDGDEEKSVEITEEDEDDVKEDMQEKEQIKKVHGQLENPPPFSFKNNIPSSKSLQDLSTHSMLSVEKELETVLHQLQQHRVASLAGKTLHATNSENVEDHGSAKTKTSSSSHSGVSDASGGSFSTTTEVKGDLCSFGEEQTRSNHLSFSSENFRQRNDRRRYDMHRENFQSTEKNISVEEKKNGYRAEEIRVPPADFPCDQSPREVVQEEDIQLCEEDMQTLKQIENEVAREMSKLAIIRRHR